MTQEIVIPDNKRLCQCGCDELIDKYDKHHGRERFYKKGHHSRLQEIRVKIGQSQAGKIRKDNVGYKGLHNH